MAKNASDRRTRATSDVGALLSIGLATGLYGLLLGGAYAMPAGFRALLLERGWIPHVIMVLTALSGAILILKVVRLRIQRRAFRGDVLPEGDLRIDTDNVAGVIEHVEARRATHRRVPSILTERVLRLLEHYAARGDVAETAGINSADADADSSAVASSFSLVKVLVWAIPIVGFIGTVIGIGLAVGGFSASLEGAEQLETIKSSLGDVTSGLAIAFDTTLVALVASILVMFPTSAIQKAEERLVNDVDDFCVSEVLRRLASPQEAEAVEATERPVFDAEALRRAIVTALSEPVALLINANAQLMNRLSSDYQALAGAQSALEGAQRDLSGQLEAFATAAQSLGPNVQHAVAQLEQATALAARTNAAMGASSDQLCRELGASRQLLSILAAGMGQPAPPAEHAANTNGSNGHAQVGE